MDGTLEFLGRVDFQVKLRGYRIELGEIEAALAGHPDVREAVVMARDDDGNGDTRLVGYLVWRHAVEDGVAQLREHLRASLPDFMVPSHFVVLREMPRTPNQKIDRRMLPSPAAVAIVAPSARPAVAPAGELELIVAEVWQEVLKLSSVGVEDNFFDLGGHSLLAVQVHSRLKKALERDLNITDLFRFPTIRGLVEFLGGGPDTKAVQSGLDRAAQRREMAARRVRRPIKLQGKDLA
jgi:acyl carrier protein